MPRQNLSVDGKIGGKNCKVRKRGCSSSSSSSLVHNYRLKRAFLVGKRGGSSTPVMPMWKMMSSANRSPSSSMVENESVLFKYLAGGEKGKDSSVSARKLAATLWEINGLASQRENIDQDKISEVGGVVRKESSRLGSMALCLQDPIPSPLYERMDPPKAGSHRRRASVGSQKLLQGVDGNHGAHNPLPLQNGLVEVDQTKNHARSPCRQISGTKNRLKDVYNSLATCKELLKVMSHIWRVEQQNSTCLSLVSALRFELDRASHHVGKLIHEQRTNRSEIDLLLKQFQEEKVAWKMKEQDRIHNAITSIDGELEIEKKLRRQSDRLNKNLGREMAETKASLSKAIKELESEKRAREILEQACDELARGVGEDRAEVEELKRQSEKVYKEVEKEREMLQLADALREERVQMKLLEAKYQFEEKNALVDTLRNELEAYLKSKTGEEEDQGDGSPSYDKIKELEKYLRKTLPGGSCVYPEITNENKQVTNEEEDDEEEDNDEDSAVDSDLHSIELNMDDISRSFQWTDAAAKNKSRRNSVDKSKGRKSTSEKKKISNASEENAIEWEFAATKKQEKLDVLNKRGLFEFVSQPWKNDVEDELERYNMIKDLRDHIVSGSRMGSVQDLPSTEKKFVQQSVSSKDLKGLVCEG